MWGNFQTDYAGNELAQVDRGLYGANAEWKADATTAFGERRASVGAFGAEPGTIAGRDEFRGTGGSLFYLRNQDILSGSERLRIEMRDKDSQLVTGTVDLRPGLDYDIDYLQGRILLSEPLSSTGSDNMLVRSGGLSGDEAWLVARYEYAPGFDEIDTLTTGGRAHVWITDHVGLGLTGSHSSGDVEDNGMLGADLTLRKSAETWLKVQSGRTRAWRRIRSIRMTAASTSLAAIRRIRRCGSRRLPRRPQPWHRRRLEEGKGSADPVHAGTGCRLLGAGPGDAVRPHVLRRHAGPADRRQAQRCRQGRPPGTGRGPRA